MKKIDFLNDPIKNVVGVILTTVFAYVLTLSFYFNSVIAGSIRYLFYPCFVTLFTLTLYLVSLLYFKKYNWIISITGISVMLFSVSLLI